VHIDYKLNKYLKITYCTNGMFRPQKTPNKIQIKLYDTLDLLTLLHGSENWTIKARYTRSITAAEMKYVRRTEGYSWTDYESNTEIAKELNNNPSLGQNTGTQKNWVGHENIMPRNRLLRIIKKRTPRGRRNQERPLNRLVDVSE
jgi:hypothetical protein